MFPICRSQRKNVHPQNPNIVQMQCRTRTTRGTTKQRENPPTKKVTAKDKCVSKKKDKVICPTPTLPAPFPNPSAIVGPNKVTPDKLMEYVTNTTVSRVTRATKQNKKEKTPNRTEPALNDNPPKRSSWR